MGITEEDRKGLDKSLKDLNLSNEEADKFAKAFKDPEFIKLFEEYAKEVSDPNVKAETDMYLRQLEMEGRVEEVYGKGSQLILPTPAFVVKTQDTNDSTKAFINICLSDKVEKASLKSTVGANGQKGSKFDMPLCLGPKKSGTDKKGGACSVWDFVVNPETLAMAEATPAVMQTMVETAMEHIEASNVGTKLRRKYKLPKLPYKATEACPTPHALAIRGPGGEAVNGRVKPAAPPAVPVGSKVENPIGSVVAPSGNGTRSSFSFESKSKRAPKPAIKDPTVEGFQHPGGEVTPKWSVVHRGQVDLADAWGDAGRGMSINSTHPKELVVRIVLPDVASVSSVELDVSCSDVSISVPGRYLLKAPLPFPVNSGLGKAKFVKARQELEVVLPVIPPRLPPPIRRSEAEAEEAARAETAGSRAEEEGADIGGGVAAGEAAGGPASRDREQPDVPQGLQETASSQGAASSEESSPEGAMTENERKWADLHAAQNEGPSTDPAGQPTGQTSRQDPGQASLPGNSSGGPSSLPAATVKLQPRLTSTVADELD